MEKMEAIPQTFTKDPVFSRLGKMARYAALTDKDKKAYKESLKSYRDSYAIAETERAEGIIETARKMKALGISPELIMAATNLTMKEIEDL